MNHRRPQLAIQPRSLDDHLLKLLRQNDHLAAAWIDLATTPTRIQTLQIPHLRRNRPLRLPNALAALDVAIAHAELHIMIADPVLPARFPQNEACHDEPVPMGIQIQPAGQNWVGTAGSMVTWIDDEKHRRFGILSNAHVMAPNDRADGTKQHQPLDTQPAIATLADVIAPNPDATNYVDMALADTKIDDYHTTSRHILDLGPPKAAARPNRVGDTVIKAGRTTGITHGKCVGIGAAVKVSYGDYVCYFSGQDVFQSQTEDFSAAGDSGSLILEASTLAPTALLFAGGGGYTIGNPAPLVAATYGLDWLW